MAGTIVATSRASVQRASPNMINLRIDRCTDEPEPDDQPRPSDSLSSGSTTVRPSGHARVKPLRRRNSHVVEGPISGRATTQLQRPLCGSFAQWQVPRPIAAQSGAPYHSLRCRKRVSEQNAGYWSRRSVWVFSDNGSVVLGTRYAAAIG